MSAERGGASRAEGRSSAFQGTAQHLQILGDLAIVALQFLDPAHAVHDRGVIAPAKAAADLGQAAAGQLLGQIHRHLARPRDGAHALWADQDPTGGCCNVR